MGDASESQTSKHFCMQLFDPKGEAVREGGLSLTNYTPPQDDPEALTMDKRWLWPNGKTLKVRFLSHPSDKIISKVKQYAKVWENYANLKFDFVNSGSADIRVAFVTGDGSWSYVGTEGERWVTDQNKPTMNYGWFTDSTDEVELRRVICHEFGHAIGAQHEQVSPNFPFTWNQDAIYKYFTGPPNNWTPEQVRVNFNNFEPMPRELVEATEWDGTSIMQYSINADFINEGREILGPTDLSQFDKAFIGRIYPKPRAPIEPVQVFVEDRMSGARPTLKVPIDGRSRSISALLGRDAKANAVGVNGVAPDSVKITLSGNGQSFKLNNGGLPALVASGQPVDISQWTIVGEKSG